MRRKHGNAYAMRACCLGAESLARGAIVDAHAAGEWQSVRRTRLVSRIYKGLLAIVVVSALAMYGVTFVPDTWIYSSKFRDANDVIRRVEAFRRTQGRLPATLLEIGRTDDERGPLFYNVWADDRYVVSFTAPRYGFFGTLAYDSLTKRGKAGTDEKASVSAADRLHSLGVDWLF
jgi:hypothetical protein